jgi:hypothetical protein
LAGAITMRRREMVRQNEILREVPLSLQYLQSADGAEDLRRYATLWEQALEREERKRATLELCGADP